MKTRHLGRAVVALVATAAAVGLMALPASANAAQITSGTMEIYAADTTLLFTLNLDGSGTTVCSAATGTFTVSGTLHTWDFTTISHTSLTIGTVGFTIFLGISLGGSSSNTGTSVGTSGAALLRLYRNNSSSCSHLTTTYCEIAAVAIVVTATHNVTSTGVTPSKTATMSGDNGPPGDFGFEVSVTGSPTDCGALSAADDGTLTLVDLVLHATT